MNANSLAVGIQLQSPQMLGAAMIVGALIVAAVLLLYPGQLKLLPGVWRFWLPALRCAALLALAVSVARPVAQRHLEEQEQGAVVVLLDKSRSMSVRDTQRTPAMLVALADGLGRLPAGARTRGEAFATIAPDIERLPELLEPIKQAQVELDVAQLQGMENPAAQKRFDEAVEKFDQSAKALAAGRARLKKSPKMVEALAQLENLPPVKERPWAEWLDAIEKAISLVQGRAAQFQTDSDDALYRSNSQVKAICDELKGLTRFGLVEEALVNPETGLLSKLPAKAPLFGYAIGPEATPVALRGHGQNVRRILVDPDGGQSDLTGDLREVSELLRYQPVQSVILFSDGRQVGAEAAVASRLLGGGGAKVYTVCPAPLEKGAAVVDVAIERVSLPRSLFLGETLNVAVEVRWSGLGGKPPPEVTLRVANEQQRRTIKAESTSGGTPDHRGSVSFSVSMTEPGPQRVTVSVAAAPGEISTDNNTATRWVKVLSDRFDVLLVGGSASWDFRYLRNALARTPWINHESVLLDQDNARLAMPASQIPTKDVIILCDAAPKALSNEQWEALRRMVAQRGGSLILMAGQAHLPREYTGEFLSEFLPYRRPGTRPGASPVWRMWPGEEPEFRVVPAPNAPVGDVLALDENAQVSAERWITLPPVFRFLALPELKEVAQPLLVERGSGAPVLTRQRLGRGKVFFLGIDETWRWRSKVGERDQDRFFQQLIRAAADEPYAVTNSEISLDADRVMIEPGESVNVRARVFDPSYHATEQGGAEVEVVDDQNNAIQTQRLGVVGPEDSGRYEGGVGGLAAGEYRLRMHGPEGSQLEYPLHVAKSFEAEMANLSPDEDMLRRFASSSGGEFRTLEQFKELPQQLSRLREQEPKTAELRLWSSWYLYAFVVACLGAEWALRKRLGLA